MLPVLCIRIDSLGGLKRTGEISYISEVADAGARTTRMEIRLDNSDRRLRSGQIVTSRLLRRMLTGVVMVPLASVIPLEKGYRVYVVADGKAQPREIELGFFRGTEVRVLSGLRAGDELSVRGHHYVAPGQAVKVVGRQGEGEPATRPAQTAPATREERP